MPPEGNRRKGPHYPARFYFVIYLALCLLTLLNWWLAKARELPGGHLWVAFGLATAVAALMMFFFMHLATHHGMSRMVMGIAVIFVGLLSSLALLDVLTRWGPTNPPGPEGSQLIPHRPAPTRTLPNDLGPPPPHRMPGE